MSNPNVTLKKVNLNVTINMINGKPMKDEYGQELKANKVLGNTLYLAKAEKDAIAQKKLAEYIYNSEGEIELTTEQIALCKNLIKQLNMASVTVATIEEALTDFKE